jgi:hypothetical protein
MFFRWRIALLALGTVLGYGLGIHSMHRSEYRRQAFERHVAEVCVGAANSLKSPGAESRAPGASGPAAP